MAGMENDLGKLKGIGPKRTAMLEKIGVDSIRELAQRNPDSLADMIKARHGKAAGVSASTVKAWVTQAKRSAR